MANYDFSVGTLTDIGNYSDASFYGTFDQAGNAFEWNDAVIGSSRGLRGGSWGGFGDIDLRSSGRFSGSPVIELTNVGFRLARPPEGSGF